MAGVGAAELRDGAGGARLSFTLEGDTPSGGGADGSVIWWAPGNAGYTVLNVTGAGDVLLRNLNIGPQSAAQASAGHVACGIADSSWLRLENVNVYGTGAGSPGGAAKGLVIGPCGSGSIHGCDIEAQVTAFEMGKGAISCAVTNCLFAAVRGTGGACCQMYGDAQTMQLTNVITQAGDYGVQMISDGVGIPEFLFMNNVQVNDAGITAGDFAAGSEVFANQFWAIANNLGTDLVHGLNFHPGFLGGAYFTNMNISDLGGHGIWIQGGGGYSFIGGSVGGCGSNAANSYDNVPRRGPGRRRRGHPPGRALRHRPVDGILLAACPFGGEHRVRRGERRGNRQHLEGQRLRHPASRWHAARRQRWERGRVGERSPSTSSRTSACSAWTRTCYFGPTFLHLKQRLNNFR